MSNKTRLPVDMRMIHGEQHKTQNLSIRVIKVQGFVAMLKQVAGAVWLGRHAVTARLSVSKVPVSAGATSKNLYL
jgi:hypothetical protein